MVYLAIHLSVVQIPERQPQPIYRESTNNTEKLITNTCTQEEIKSLENGEKSRQIGFFAYPFNISLYSCILWQTGPEGRCDFPGRWEGNWFQSGIHQTITINRNTINTKGRCLEASGEKYLVFNE